MSTIIESTLGVFVGLIVVTGVVAAVVPVV